MNKRRVVITGLGLATPLGCELEAIWTALLEKRSGIRRITAFDPAGFRSQIGGEVPPFNLGDFIPKGYRKSIKIMSRDIQLALVASYLAVKDAGLVTKCVVERDEAAGRPVNMDPARFGANIGAGLICADINELAGALHSAVENGEFSITKWGREGMNNLTPLWLLKFLPNMLACHVTIVHDAQAPSNTITCGEASSHLAIGEACRIIERGDADVCIGGGAESKMNPMGLIRQDLFDRLARTHNDHPENACRPFDCDHCGTAASEGAGLIILEEFQHAQKRGAKIYGEVVGFGAGTNTTSWKEPDPDGHPIAQAVEKALNDAGLRASDIDLVVTFGSGIPAFDEGESAGLNRVFGSGAAKPLCMALKGALGNNGAGSGAIDLALGLLAMKHNTIPAACNVEKLADQCRIPLVTGRAVDARIQHVLAVSYALSGGQTAALVVRKI